MAVTKKRRAVIWPWLICGVYFFAGVTALGYEVLWAKMLSTLFGVSIFGVVITVSAFMAGLGGGSLLGGRLQHKIRSPLLFLAAIEFVVALFAFNLPHFLEVIDLQVSVMAADSSFSLWFFYQSVFTFILMMLPAFLLGLGFPMVLSALRDTKVSVAVIYGVNTLGGVVGALLPLVLLPAVGWAVSGRLFALLGMLLAISLLFVHFFNRRKTVWQRTEEVLTSKTLIMPLIAYAGIGASAIMLQIAWTRLYGMVLLRTEYVMAVILATFLIGIGLGSFLGARFQYKFNFLVFPLLVAVCALVSLYALPWVSAWAESASYSSLSSSMFTQALVIGLFTLPATLVFGAWFPLLASHYKNMPQTTAYLYGANSIGAALGGLLVGFLILPLLGSTYAIIVAVVLMLIASCFWVEQRWFRYAPLLAILFFLPVMSFPEVKVLLPASQGASKDLSFYEDAISIAQVVEQDDGHRILLSDLQRMDASTDPTAITLQKNQARLALLLHPKPRSILFLGLGTGITASGSLPYPDLERTSVELSQGAINAAMTYFSESNHSVMDQLTVVRDDARRFLKVTGQSFDVIVGDLFHPDMVGRSALLSLQQFERAKKRLNKDGLFVQWIALNQFDLNTLKVILQTFRVVFPDAVVFMDGFRVALVGFNGQFYGAPGVKQNFSRLSSAEKIEATGGEGVWTWVGRYWGRIPEMNVAVQDEWAPVIEFQLPQAKFNRQIDLRELLVFMIKNRPSMSAAAIELKMSEKDIAYFSRVYASSEMYAQSWVLYFDGKQEESQKLLSMAYEANPDDQWVGFGLADMMFASFSEAVKRGYGEEEVLNKILDVRSDHIEALRKLMQLHLAGGDAKAADVIKRRMKLLAPLDRELQ